MARDARRTMSVTFSEEQTRWIEAQIAAGAPDKGTVIKAAIDRAMADAPSAPRPTPTATAAPMPTAPTCPIQPSAMRELSLTLDILLKKYMADHSGREISDREQSDLSARWDAIVALRTSGGA